MTAKRYIVQKPQQPGRHFEQFGWRVLDTRPDNPNFRTIASGGEREMRRWARSLNAR